MKKIDQHFKEMTKQVFARYGFARGEVLSRWQEIVGDDLAKICRPKRIRWPRKVADDATIHEKTSGTLVVQAGYGHGLMVQHQATLIIERVNQFYGYNAIGALKVTQGKLPTQKQISETPPLTGEQQQKLLASLDQIGDDKLKQALDRLGRATLRERAARRQS